MTHLRLRTILLSTVSLLASPAYAQLPSPQLAPNAQPQGGVVSAGSAAITQTSTRTTITQTSSRAAVDWTSFNVGRDQGVTFAQPSRSAVTLNRVNSPNPSHIAGQIDANGQVVIVNQSGVVFEKGAQVNAASLVVSASGISNKNFMAGQMVFDQPAKPDAKVVNAGTITVSQAGLAALVAPAVVNSGVINAKLGHVILAGAETHTLDLYGDGLLSIDVTGQVTQAPTGRDGKPVKALVTNTGTVRADGGTVLLTASAVDGVVQNLVTADGRVYAHTLNGKTGTIVVSGTGGSVQVLGDVSVAGRGANASGGQIEVNASDNVTIGAKARLNASGRNGGGVIAIGTTRARAIGGATVTPTLTAANVTVASGARVNADATAQGNGGQVTLLSTGTTTQSGTITARGGKQSGNGGQVEISGVTVSLGSGSVDVSAANGAPGNILLDPLDLYISSSGVEPDGSEPVPTTPGATAPNISAGSNPDANTTSYVTPAQLAALTGNIYLEATRDIYVNSPITLTNANQGLSLQAGANFGNLTVNAPITIPGALALYAGSATTSGSTTITANLTAGSVYINGGATSIGAVITSNTTTYQQSIVIVSDGPFKYVPGVTVLNAQNGYIQIAPSTATENYAPATLDSSIYNAQTLVLGGSNGQSNGSVSSLPYGGAYSYDSITFNGSYNLGGKTLVLYTGSGGAIEASGAALLSVGELDGASIGALSLGGANQISSLGSFQANTIYVNNSSGLSINGALSAGTIIINAVGILALSGQLATGSIFSNAGAQLTVSGDSFGNATFTTIAGSAAGAAPLTGYTTADLGIVLTGQGNNANFAGGLNAPQDNLTLNIGSGFATGNLNVANLFVNGSGGSTSFTNSTVQGQTGSQAAAVSFQSGTTLSSNYLLNGCVIGSPTCAMATVTTPVVTTPVTTTPVVTTPVVTTPPVDTTAPVATPPVDTTPATPAPVTTSPVAAPPAPIIITAPAPEPTPAPPPAAIAPTQTAPTTTAPTTTAPTTTAPTTTAGALAAAGGLTAEQGEAIATTGNDAAAGVSAIVAAEVNTASVAITQSQRAQPRGVPVVNPLRDLANGPLRNRQDDPDLLLPNVSEKDY